MRLIRVFGLIRVFDNKYCCMVGAVGTQRISRAKGAIVHSERELQYKKMAVVQQGDELAPPTITYRQYIDESGELP